MNLTVQTFPVAPLGCNCTILCCTATKEAIVIDPGGDADRIIALLERDHCRVRWIIHTHAHFDHCLGTAEVSQFVENHPERPMTAPRALHKGDLFLYEMLGTQCRWFGLPPVDAEVSINHFLSDEETLPFGKLELQVLHTPGHTPGSCCFYLPENELLFSGDTLFAGGIGRTDLPGGDSEQIVKSIRNRLFTLDDGTSVVPGHGDFTRIYEEKTTNPFL